MIPSIAFPVLGPVKFSHDYGHPRGEHGERFHEGLDLIGVRGQPLRAAFDGVVTRIQTDTARDLRRRADDHPVRRDCVRTTSTSTTTLPEPTTTPAPQACGSTRTSASATPSRPARSSPTWATPATPSASRTSTSSCAPPDGVSIDPYPAVVAAQQREQCSVGIGPWSTDFVSPTEEAKFFSDFDLLSPRGAGCDRCGGAANAPTPVVHFIAIGPDGARWEIDDTGQRPRGRVGALIQPGSGSCETVPSLDVVYGSDAAGVGRDLLPADWWDVGVTYSGAVTDDDLDGGDGTATDEWVTAAPPAPAPAHGPVASGAV